MARRVGRGGHVAAVAQVMPKQGGDGVRNVEPVRAKPEPGGGAGARDVGGAQGGDRADLLAVEQDEAAGDAVAGRDCLVEHQPPDRRESRLGAGPRASASVWITGKSMPRRMFWQRAQDRKVRACCRVLGLLANHLPRSCWVHSPSRRPRLASEVKNAIATMRRYLARW